MSQAAGNTALASAVRTAAPRVASVRMRVVCLLLAVAWTWACASRGAFRAASDDPVPDFEYFYKGGAWLLQHGALDPGHDLMPNGEVVARGSLEWYLPFVPRMMTLIAWLPAAQAGSLWFGLNVVMMFVMLRLVGQHLVGGAARNWPVTQLAPLLLLTVFWHWEYRLNQIDNLTLLLLVGSFVCWQQRQHVVAGLWLGLAVLVKVTPGLLVVWFVLKRQYRTAAAAGLTVLLAGPAADLIVFGPADAADRYHAWFRKAVSAGSHRGLILTQTEMDWRNQGMGAVLSRWLHPTDYALHYDNDPRLWARDARATMNVLDLPRGTVAAIATGVQGLSLLALLWLARHAACRLSPWRLRLEWALFLLAMLWFMPVMRGYHLIWALPALSLLGALRRHLGRGDAWSTWALVCMIGLVAVQLSLRWELPQAAGILLWTVALLALPLVMMIRRLERNPALLASCDGLPAAPTGVG